MKRSTATCSSQAGFTLLEVLVALGILATSYIALLETLSGSIRLSTYGRQVTVAAFLAQAKLEQTEEKLIKDGFPIDSEESNGNFEDSGYRGYRWKMEVRKVELPVADALNHLLSNRADEDGKKKGAKDKGKSGHLGNLGGIEAGGMKGSMGGMLTGALGQAGGAGSALLNADMLKGNVELLSKQIEEVLREVRLIVEWGEGGPGKQLIVTTHVVQVPQSSGAAGAQPSLTSSATGTGLPLTNIGAGGALTLVK